MASRTLRKILSKVRLKKKLSGADKAALRRLLKRARAAKKRANKAWSK